MNDDRLNQWKLRHAAAFRDPNPEELPIVSLVSAFISYAEHAKTKFDWDIGNDGVLGPHWLAIGKGIVGLLDGPMGTRLDGGTLWSAIDMTLKEYGYPEGLETDD